MSHLSSHLQRSENSALGIASMKGETEVVSLLLEAGADIDIHNWVCLVSRGAVR